MMNIKIKFADDSKLKKLPIYSTEGSAGMDFFSCSDYILPQNSIVLVKTNICMDIPDGYELQIRSRSGLALKNGVFVLNAPGTIDSDYRGEIGIIMCNLSSNEYKICTGDRVAQGVIAKYEKAVFDIVDSISETTRSSGGFGSTGLK